jgi:hypothetical protein
VELCRRYRPTELPEPPWEEHTGAASGSLPEDARRPENALVRNGRSFGIVQQPFAPRSMTA